MKLLVPFFEASTSLKNFEFCRSNWAFFNWDSFPSRLNSHYKAWSYKKKKHEEILSIQEISAQKLIGT